MPMVPVSEKLFLEGPVGKLEAMLDAPREPEPHGAVVVCHPHPQHGGTMHNKVVTIMERSMRELGMRTIRFNFRGAGESEGEHDEGYGETDDLFAVTEWVRHTRPNDDLWLGGFSFGSYISVRAAQNLKLGQLITIAPPVDRYPFSQLQHPDCPWLVIQGDEDEVVALADRSTRQLRILRRLAREAVERRDVSQHLLDRVRQQLRPLAQPG